MVTLEATYIMPRHKTSWVVSRLTETEIDLRGKHTILPCKLATFKWLLKMGVFKAVS